MKHRLPALQEMRALARHRIVAKFTLVMLASLLVACSIAASVDSIERADISKTAARQPVVIGRLHIQSAGGISIMPYQPGPSDERPRFPTTVALVRILPDATLHLAYVRADGRFAWGLDQGTYIIEDVRGLSKPLHFNYAFCPKAVFRVKRPNGIVNLGEILIKFPTDPTLHSLTPGFFGADRCVLPDNQVDVTQEAGEITRIVLHPLTTVSVIPEIPDLWGLQEEIGVNHPTVREARALLHERGITNSN